MYMTILFVKPLMNSNVGRGIRIDWKASRLHHVARRTLVASIVAQLVSFANILTLTVLNGRERGVLCLTCCTVDVTINVITIHWVKFLIRSSPFFFSFNINIIVRADLFIFNRLQRTRSTRHRKNILHKFNLVHQIEMVQLIMIMMLMKIFHLQQMI